VITKASELLTLFIAEETRKVAGMAMPHMPTLGSAYEEITKQGIDSNFVIPNGLDLRVVKGFVTVAGKQLPNQIDCMLVVGNGTRYGLTDQYIYDLDQVLCIFEVKKTLTKKDFRDAILHLSDIRRAFSDNFAFKVDNDLIAPDISHARKSFSQITGKIAPEHIKEVNRLPKLEAFLLHALIQEQYAPVTIIHGYEGYTTETGLRKAFADILIERRKTSGKGLGVTGLTSLVTSNEFCLVKGNGHPYLAVRDDRSWVAFLSTRHNPARIILELIWSKISHYFELEMPFGTDQEIESVAPLMVAEATQKGQLIGWNFQIDDFKEKSLSARDEHLYWSPKLVGAAEADLINTMMFRGGEVTKEKELDAHLLNEFQRTYDKVVQNLLATRMFAMKGKALRPVAAHTLLLPNDADGSAYIALDRNRFDHWCLLNNREAYYTNFMYIE